MSESPCAQLAPFTMDVDCLNELQRVMVDLGESYMNVGWHGVPADPCVAQLLIDAGNASNMLQRVRNALEPIIGVTWNSATGSYVKEQS